MERKYFSTNKEIPAAHILRLNNLLKEMSIEEKDSCALYIEKFKRMIGDKSWSIDALNDEMDKLTELLNHGRKIVMHITCTEMTEMMGNLITQAKHVERGYEGDFSPIRARVDFVLTKVTRGLLPSLIAQSAVSDDVLEETDEYIY